MMKKNHKLSNSEQITILTFFYYMPLNYSEKDTEDSASIVQTLGAPLYKMKRKKSHVLHTQSFCVHEEKWCGFTQDGNISLSDTAAF